MKHPNRILVALGTLLLALSALPTGFGCGAPARTAPELTVFPPPYLPIPPARVTIVPPSQFMQVAVLNFVDQTGQAGRLVEVLADSLATELHRTGRFEVYDRGHLRGYDFTQVLDRCSKTNGQCFPKGGNDPAEEADEGEIYAAHLNNAAAAFGELRSANDALLLCAITSVAPGRAIFDYRLVNAHKYFTMVAGSASVSFTASPSTMRPDRTAVERVAHEIRSALPAPKQGEFGKVLVQDGPVLTISLGKKDGIIAGINVFVVGPGRGVGGTAKNPNTVDEVYLAQAYVVSVYDNTSQVVVFRGSDYRVGDNVRFK